ncbi:MAG: redoxin domain-containing protein [Xanthomonadales bacterium]
MKAAWRRLRQRKWTALLIDAALIVAVMLAVHAWQTRELPVDEPAPQTVLALLDGSGLATATRSGEPGIVYFFAPWCFYCKASIGNLDDIAAGDAAWGTAVALDYGSPDEVRAFVEETGIRLPVLLGTPQTAAAWSVRAFPTYYVIDAEGRISSRSVGYSTWLGMRARAWLAR